MRTALSRHLLRPALLGVTATALLASGVASTAAGPTVLTTDVSTSTTAGTAARATALPPTPGDFTGYGFDQCLAPTQATMNRWLSSSPYLAVGIYISGDSRACRDQPHLTPTWIRTQLKNGWKLLPITLGPQASCQPRFPRYSDDFTIDPFRGKGRYPRAREMGRASGASTVADAQKLGIPAGSTLWYDLEGFDSTNTACRESALAFLSDWVTTVKAAGFVTGVYSSAGSGIQVLDEVRATRPSAYRLPDRIWLARWDGVANTSTSYIREDGWRPGGRVKQYRGGHDETWGGVRINIDTNYLDLGKGMVAAPEAHCGSTKVDFVDYGTLEPAREGYVAPADRVAALKCLMKERGYYDGPVDGTYGSGIIASVRRWKAERSQPADDRWFRKDWTALLSGGSRPILKLGSASAYGPYVRRVQRAVNAADIGAKTNVDGTFSTDTTAAVKRYQRRVGLTQSGIVDLPTWAKLQAGIR
ncbi:glycoside hydrolase domain-containing protein [Nocardioides rubriscoriae]|uniref:glycoside hydrolase domain-containing protein n=1 Tax=Nocardioides rubriscoriae TaxID=642762 RepID=UPI0011DFD746|nr:glycoside hydrolase domain-containing protein [Nocardioides rubriscoriae]